MPYAHRNIRVAKNTVEKQKEVTSIKMTERLVSGVVNRRVHECYISYVLTRQQKSPKLVKVLGS